MKLVSKTLFKKFCTGFITELTSLAGSSYVKLPAEFKY